MYKKQQQPHSDVDMVKFLVHSGANIRARAWGTAFAPGGAMYFGEYPLSFAACTGQREVVAHLKRHGAAVNADRDQQGNTALHMTVVHSQPDMYDFLVDYCAGAALAVVVVGEGGGEGVVRGWRVFGGGLGWRGCAKKRQGWKNKH
jgi:ankyrin repeat protein